MGRKYVAAFFILTLACFLNFAAGFCEEIQLDLNIAGGGNLKSLVEIKTSKPVRCVWYDNKTFPFLIIDFIEDGILCSFEKEIILANGPVKKIKTFCSDEGYADFLVLELNHPSEITSGFLEGSLTFETDDIFYREQKFSSQRQSAVEAALLSARKKIRQEELPPGGKIIETNIGGISQALVSKEQADDLFFGEFYAAENATGENSGDVLLQAEDDLKEKETEEIVSILENDAPQNDDNISESSREKEILSSASLAVFETDFGERRNFLISIIYLFGFILITLVMIAANKTSISNGAGFIVSPEWGKNDGEITPRFENRRKYARIKNEDLKPRPYFKIETRNTENRKYKCRLKDLSLEGAGFELPPQIDVPLILQIGITLPGRQTIDICAKIVWHSFAGEGKQRYGVRFLTVSEADRQRLKEYLYGKRKLVLSSEFAVRR